MQDYPPQDETWVGYKKEVARVKRENAKIETLYNNLVKQNWV
jgi:hypothetical protein